MVGLGEGMNHTLLELLRDVDGAGVCYCGSNWVARHRAAQDI